MVTTVVTSASGRCTFWDPATNPATVLRPLRAVSRRPGQEAGEQEPLADTPLLYPMFHIYGLRPHKVARLVAS
ncbi:hypothetical protein GCM10020256_01490 [Streptomyces thermocoprophilus]